MEPPVITSTANPRVKWLAGLRKRRNREAAGRTLVEGYAEVSLALDAGAWPSLIAYCPELAAAGDGEPADLPSGLGDGPEVLTLGATAFAKVSYRQSPDGWLAVVPAPGRPLAELALSAHPLVLVAESVEKPGNLGAMLRTAEAAGADAVIAASPVTDWGNPNLIRASKGTVFAVPVAAASPAEVAAWLADRRVSVVVASPNSPSPYTTSDLTGSTALVVGAEHAGVSHAWGDAQRVRLPMAGSVNSLNVSASAAVLLYEALRQRFVRS